MLIQIAVFSTTIYLHPNVAQLAKKLGISRKCLWERRQRFGLPRKKKKAS